MLDDGPAAFPKPRYEVRTEKGIRVPMRDGIELSTDLYRPVGVEGKLPSILIRTQYGKSAFRPPEPEDSVSLDFAAQGFVVIVQELRGLFESDGAYALAKNDAMDGYDCLSWIAAQEWSSGRIGTYGCSSLGITQIFLAQTCHPAHACAIAQGSGGGMGSARERYRHWDFHRGGAIELGWTLPWFYESGRKDGSQPEPRSEDEYLSAMTTLPIIDALKCLTSAPTDWEEWVSHHPGDPWWEQFGFLTDESKIAVPTLFVNSWHDVGAADALLQRELFSERGVSPTAREHQHAIISPATHCMFEKLGAPTVVGEREFGDARLECWQIYLDWFDEWLRDQRHKVTRMPKLRYFVMGKNEWRASESWPPPGSKETRWYLRSGGRANSSLGDGLLSADPPTVVEPADCYEYDPANPVPSLGWGAGQYCGPLDYQEVEKRRDVLCYTSDPLAQGIEVSGFVRARLYVSSSAPDTDFVVKLLDVFPDGRAFDVVHGVLRARYREGFDRINLMEPGDIYMVDIDMDATSNWFGIGHRIRFEVSSSAFPRFDRNLNTGGRNWDETRWMVANNSVHHGGEHQSHLVLYV